MTGTGTTERLVHVALAGATQASVDEALLSTTPEGGLVGALSTETAERRLLLAAGARAIYRLASYAPERLDAPLEPAPAETKTVCPASISSLFYELFPKGDISLQLYALERMIAAGLIAPPELLLRILNIDSRALRAQVAQVAGERGAWLGRFNSDWEWVEDELVRQCDDIAAQADTLWQNGSPADRLQALKYWRATDPVKARDEVMAVWRQEKADFRYKMLATLTPTWDDVVATDEPLLELALDDRAAEVRATAQRALARIPGSAYSQRAIARADTLVNMSVGRNKKKLAITLPGAHEKSWERDGIEEKPRQGIGERSWWLMQIIMVTPPAHWVERFGMAPAELIAATPGERYAELLEGWAHAALRYQANDWAPALVEAWRKRPPSRPGDSWLQAALVGPLILLPHQDLEAMALKILREGETKQDAPWTAVEAALPRTWSAEVARAWLASLRAYASDLSDDKRLFHDPLVFASKRALSMPRECLDEALAPWDIDTTTTTTAAIIWRERLDNFLTAARLRQRIDNEIPGAPN